MLTRRRMMLTAGSLALTHPAMAGEPAIRVRDLYARDGSFSEQARALDGQRITVEGFMAPPLKAESRFFVLTKMPMAVCPFCETEAEWPDDILAIYTKRVVQVTPFNVRIEARGVLELGSFTDPDTGFLSMLRLTDASYG